MNFNQIPPITKGLLILNSIFYIIKLLLEAKDIDLDIILGAFYPLSSNFHYYQIISHMFMHGNFPHFLFNMFALWMFGSVVEHAFGDKKYLFFYFLCGFGAFFLYNLINYWEVQQIISNIINEGGSVDTINNYTKWNIHGQFDNPDLTNRMLAWIKSEPTTVNQSLLESIFLTYSTPMVGASGAIFGLLVAYGMMYPNAELMLIFFPIPIKAKYFIPILIAYELFAGIYTIKGESFDNIAHFAHLGGAIIGYFYTKNFLKNRKYGHF